MSVHASRLPPQGLYEECEPANRHQCAVELAQLSSGGFQLVLNYSAWYGSASDVRAYARTARADRVQVIWPLNYAGWRDAYSARTLLATYSRLAADCRCAANGAFVRFAIELVRSLPATWGYYIGDELGPAQASTVANLAAEVRKLDPRHPLLYISRGTSDLGTTLGPFASLASVVGADIYPIGTGASASAVSQIADTVQQLSRSAGTRPALVLQAFSWTEYPGQVRTIDPRWPTEAEMQAMRNEALAINPSLILWYSLHDILRSHDPTEHWRDLVQAAFAPRPAQR